MQTKLDCFIRWHQHEPLSLGMRLAQVENKAKFVVPFFQYWNNVEEEEGNVDDEEDEDQEERIKEELPTLKD